MWAFFPNDCYFDLYLKYYTGEKNPEILLLLLCWRLALCLICVFDPMHASPALFFLKPNLIPHLGLQLHVSSSPSPFFRES